MATDPNNMVGQSEAIYTALNNFFTQAQSAVQSGGTFPSMSDQATNLAYTELLRLVTQSSDYSANYVGGSAVETIHLATAMLREYAMRTKPKSEYYIAGAADHSIEADYYNRLKYLHTHLLGGGGVNGSLTQ